MCGRFALYASPARLKEHFATANDPDLEPRFNIAPAQTVLVVRVVATSNRVFTVAHWGLLPSHRRAATADQRQGGNSSDQTDVPPRLPQEPCAGSGGCIL